MLRCAGYQIECTFGRLKARWAVLTRKVDLKLEKVPHNLLSCRIIFEDKEKDEESVKVQIEFDKQNKRNHINVLDQIYSTDGSEELPVRR